ncbi:MAG TPA: penicillin-binding protein 2 [Candidatus Binatia bacterium]|nr:penicillin-binding protein 2 [Candidatus Binatia bacterium]
MPEDHTTWHPVPGPFPITDGETGFGAVRAPYADSIIDEAFLGGDGIVATDMAAQPAFIGLAIGERKLKAVFAALAAMLTLVVLRAGHVQIVKSAEYARLAEGNRSRQMLVPVERGVMYDRNGTPLVRNVPDFSVAVTPADLPKDPEARRQAIGRLAAMLDLQPTDIEQKLEEFKDYAGSAVTVADNLTHDQAVRVEIENASAPGVSLAVGTRREYLASADAPSLSHVLGFEGRLTQKELDASGASYQPSDFIGKTGLERFYEPVLRGSYGKRRIEVDATGREKKVLSEETGQPGRNLVLTLDLDLQKDVEKIFRDGLRAAGKKRGSVIVMKPSTGEVLAMVSEPAFDNNMFAKGITPDQFKALTDDPDHPLFPRAVSGEVASGSVFKLAVGAAAMAEHVITPNTTVLSTGGIRVDKWFFPDWKAGGHGPTNLAKALAESVNTFFYYVGGGYDDFKGLGIDRIAKYAHKFGLGQPLGIDLPAEASGFLPSKEWKEKVKKEQWYVGDTYHAAIGQGDVLVTPLQIATMTAVFANRGALVRPHVVAATTAADGTRTQVDPVTIDPQVVDAASIDAVRRGLRQAVTSGSARSLGDLPVAVAGKTGTAQWHPTKAPHAWFTSYAPYDKPEIVVTVMIEEGVEGSTTATPIAKAIYRRYFAKPASRTAAVPKPPAAPPAATVPAPVR